MKYLPSVYPKMKQLVDAEADAAVATVISRKGSGPREPGAVMLVEAGGSIVGSVGGGSLEAVVMRKAEAVISTGQPVCETFSLSNDAAAEDGMICGGTMEVLIQRLVPSNPIDLGVIKKYLNSLRHGGTVWLITAILETPGACQTAMGFLSSHGADRGTLPIDDKEMNDRVARSAGQVPFLYDTKGARIFFQPVKLPDSIYIFGAGHIAAILAPFCRAVDFSPIVVDDRIEFANTDRFPDAGQVLVVESFEGCFKQFEIDANSFLVAVTRGHAHDKTVIAQALKTPAKYIGMIGSRRKREAIYELLCKQGVAEDELRRIHCPVGLSIGAQSPAEIAVSIVAELIAVRAGYFNRLGSSGGI